MKVGQRCFGRKATNKAFCPDAQIITLNVQQRSGMGSAH